MEELNRSQTALDLSQNLKKRKDYENLNSGRDKTIGAGVVFMRHSFLIIKIDKSI